MKFLLLIFISFISLTAAAFQVKQNLQNDSLKLSAYDIAVSFNSICCGPPSDAFLHELLDTFNRKNKVQVSAWQLGGCGREGESKILFSLKKLKKTTAKKFITLIKKTLKDQNDKNKTANASSGDISLEYNIFLKDITNCRDQLKSFYQSKK